MNAEEIARALISVHHLQPDQRYLICVDRENIPNAVAERLASILLTEGIRCVVIKTRGRPRDVMQVIDLEPGSNKETL